jgi:RHS repeat-associated protein
MSEHKPQHRVFRPIPVILTVAILCPVAHASITVCPAGPPKCTYTTIQEALSEAKPGDTITVMEPGPYAGGNLSPGGGKSGITLTSKSPPDRDLYIIDGGGTAPVVNVGGGIDLLRGFTITGGNSIGSGGGILVHGDATIDNCVIRNNVADTGGAGVHMGGGATLTITNSLIHHNDAEINAGLSISGSLFLFDSEVYSNSAVRNTHPTAGGLAVGNGLFMANSKVYNNEVFGVFSGGQGGGIVVSGNTTIVDSEITGNSAPQSSGSGGGLVISSGVAEISGTTITGNSAGDVGGGIMIGGGSGTAYLVGVTISGNTVAGSGGGIICTGAGVLEAFSGTLSGNTVDDHFGCTTCTPGVSEDCSTGLDGICGPGTRSCAANGLWGPCTPKFGSTPKELICDDVIDNDCDGATDSSDEDCGDIWPATSSEVPESGDDGDPVNTLTGELFNAYPPDLHLGGPLPVFFARYYASGLDGLGRSGRLGTNWRHNFEWSLVDDTGTTGLVHILDPTGRPITFEQVGSDFELRDLLDVRYQLADTGSTLTLGHPDTGMLYTFDGTGKLVEISDGTANTLTLTYTGADLTQVVDSLGRVLTFSYDVGGLLETVNDGTLPTPNRTVTFGHTVDDLTSVVDARGLTTSYAYDAGGLMTSWTLPEGNSPYTQTWDGSGRVATQTTHPSISTSHTTTFTWDTPPGVTNITDPASNTRTHTHSPDGQLTDVESEDGQSYGMSYDSIGDRLGVTDRLGDTTAVTFHQPSGKAASITQADGTTTSFSYSARTVSGITFYDLARIDYPDGTFESLSWSLTGELTSRLDRAGEAWSFVYNTRGRILSATNPAGGETIFTYDTDGTRLSRTDPSTNTTIYGYDSLRRLNLITRPDMTTVSFTYDDADNLLTVTDERTNTTTFTYDDNGNLETITDPLTHTTTFGYDGLDRLKTVTDALGNPATLAYDALGRVASATGRGGDTTTFGYDARGRLTSVTDGEAKVWPRGWDAESVPLSAADPLGNTADLTSDAMGRITEAMSPLGHATAFTYDAMGRLIRVTDPTGRATDLAYDPRGLLAGITREGLSTSIDRDELGLITTVTDPNGKAWLRVWDDQGRLTLRTDPLANQTTFTYDDRNRVDVQTFPGGLGTLTPTYDGVGNITQLSYFDGVTTTNLNYTYDTADRLTSADGVTLDYDANDRLISSNGLTMTRDLDGRIDELTLAPGKAVDYDYDGRGLLSQVTDWTAAVTTFTYDDAARLTGITRPNGVNTVLTYDADSRLATITDGAIASQTLTYDDAGRLIRNDRVVPTAGSASGVTPTSHTFDDASQVTGFTYDALGRLTNDGGRTYDWDLASRLTSVTEGANTVTYSYDALGHRISRTEGGSTRGYVWNYALGLPSINVERTGGPGGTDLRYHITTPGGMLLYSLEASDSSRRDHHYDQVGNVLFLTNPAGAVIASYAYDPYGQVLASTGAVDNAFTWQGMYGVMTEVGSTGATDGLYYLRARHYDSDTRRFLSRDAVATFDPTTTNPYQYAAGAPTRFIDPFGLQSRLKEYLQNNPWIGSTDPLTLKDLRVEEHHNREARIKRKRREQASRLKNLKRRLDQEAINRGNRIGTRTHGDWAVWDPVAAGVSGAQRQGENWVIARVFSGEDIHEFIDFDEGYSNDSVGPFSWWATGFVHHELISDEINKEWFAARSATQRSDQAALAEPILPPATQREVASKSLRTIVGTITFDLWPRAVSEEPEEENRVESIIPELAGIIIY